MFDAHARSVLTAEQLVSVVPLDMDLALSEADEPLVQLLRHFGPDDPPPAQIETGESHRYWVYW